MTPVGGVIFDLDDTLFDCTGQLTDPARLRAASLLATHISETTPQDLVDLQIQLSTKISSLDAIREIGRRHDLPNRVVTEALETYNDDHVPEIAPFPDAVDTIEWLIGERITPAIVTTGRKSRQLTKIDRIGLGDVFEEGRNLWIHEQSIDQPEKTAQLEQATSYLGGPPGEIASIGDKLDSDIRVGNRLGLVTVRILKGRQKDAEPEGALETPDHTITELTELRCVLIAS